MTGETRPPLRVLHLSRFYHPHVGGTENFVAQLADAVAAHGVSSSVVTSARYADEPGPAPRVPVERLRVIGPDRLLLPYAGLRRALASLRAADVVHAHDLRFLFELAAAATAVRRVPLVLSAHGFIFHTRRFALAKDALWRSYYRLLLRRCALVLCGSAHDLEACRGIGLRNAMLWPTPVWTEPFEAVEPAAEDGGSLLYFGRLAPNKGIERLRAVLEHGPESWTLTVVGTGEERYVDRLRHLFAPLGRRVTFAGALSEGALLAVLARHACVVLPSRAEGFGLTLVEAMASGVPVVASDIAPYREIGRGTSVRFVDFDRPDAVVAGVASAVDDWDAAAARARATSFSWRRHAARLASLYRGLVDG